MNPPDEALSERRNTAQDLGEIIKTMHAMDTRVAILETRMNGQDTRLSAIELDIRETKVGVQRVVQMLEAHMRQEDRDRIKIMGGIIAILLSVVGYVGSIGIHHLFPGG